MHTESLSFAINLRFNLFYVKCGNLHLVTSLTQRYTMMIIAKIYSEKKTYNKCNIYCLCVSYLNQLFQN